VSGTRELETSAEEAILLLFLMAGSSVFLLRPRTYKEKMQACVIVPDVTDLKKFAQALQGLATATVKRPAPYLERIAGGAEEAALRLLIDMKGDDLVEKPGIAGLQAVAMGKVAWDQNQINRSTSVRLGLEYPELDVFKAACTHLGKGKILRGAKGDAFAVPASPLPELVAANLASGFHWARRFRELVSEKKDFSNMRFAQKGLHKMKEAIKDEDDRVVIDMFHAAWRNAMRELGDRAKRDGLQFERLVEVERERIRNAILRSKTADALAGWLMRFCADATRGAPLPVVQKNAPRLRSFLFNPRNAERLQNLLLFALVSYASEGQKTPKNGDN
jgi:CRISPR-associated protein Cas8a1/Csx13